MTISLRFTTIAAGLSAAALLLGACSQEDTATPARQADSVIVREQWVKATDAGMTAAFAELQNVGDTDIHVVRASSPASTSMELHEMASGIGGTMVMRPKEGGFVIPAGGTHLLGAGGDHLMLMDVTAPLTPGADTDVTLEFEDESTATFTAQVRDFAGAQENYVPDSGGTSTNPADPTASTHGG